MFGKQTSKVIALAVILLAVLGVPPGSAGAWEFSPAEMTMAVGSMGSLFGRLPQDPAFADFVQKNKVNGVRNLEKIRYSIFTLNSCLPGFRDAIARNALTREMFRESSGTIDRAVGDIESGFRDFIGISFFRDPRFAPQYEPELKSIARHLEDADSITVGHFMRNLEDDIRDKVYIADRGFLLDGLMGNLRSLDMALVSLKGMMERR